MRSKTVKIGLTATIFGILLVGLIPSMLAAPPQLFGQDITSPGAWTTQVNIAEQFATDYLGLGASLVQNWAATKNWTFDVSYVNMGNVTSLYMAQELWQWDTANRSNAGVSPAQMLIQRYQAPDGENVIAVNTFAGLVAYSENGSTRPSRNDALYYGWMNYGAYQKHVINGILSNFFNVDSGSLMDEGVVANATPIWYLNDNPSDTGNMSTAPTNATFGMTYNNLFVLWYPINIPDQPDNTVAPAIEVQQAVAWSIISSITFKFNMYSVDLGNGTEAVTAEAFYNIGPLKDLWVRGDNASVAQGFGGTSYNATIPSLGLAHSNLTVGHYNTSTAIYNRLNGTDATPGFGLGVVNNAGIFILGKNDATTGAAWDNGTPTATAIDGTNGAIQQVTHLTGRVAARVAKTYDIDFSASPDYTWNGTTSLASPTYIYPKVNVIAPIINAPFEGARWLMQKLWKNDIKGVYANSLAAENVGDLTYITTFPTWSGLSCVQDPTFTAYVSAPGNGLLSGIDFAPFGLIGLAAIPAIFLLVRKVRRQ